MARDIEEFLRKAAARRAEKSKPAPAPPAPRQPQAKRRPASPPQPKKTDTAATAERPYDRPHPDAYSRQPAPKAPPARKTRNESTIKPLEGRKGGFGKDIAAVQGQVENRVRGNLDHDINKIDDNPTVTDDPSPAIFGKEDNKTAERFRKLMQNPEDISNAIIMAEILKRPDFDD